jgi:hypothetical protein
VRPRGSVESRHIRAPSTLCKLPSLARFSSFRQLSPPSPLSAISTWTPHRQRNADDSIASRQHVIYAKHARSNAMARCLARTANARTTLTPALSPGPSLVRPSRPPTHRLVVVAGILLGKKHPMHRTRNNTRIPLLLCIPSPMASIQATLCRPL